ncbi:DNA methyltransferase [Flavobacterium sp. MDT1-60]|uniref:Eco57I restriction-modification methylase domain-containing protein n=1 Tax=Flavobacterium sp. MDT1-60 TaxID=1979344 RepID=UPI0017842359|nr:DNA methyltransferase [Flavobacterium sp. MDT1-60]QOG03005.1 N-6 DNA methylase [Flavobacterium sp. MDT1-60]
MSRIEQLFDQLGYTRENGLFYLEESDQWLNKFPFRISKVLRDIIQPYAFYSLHHHGDENSEHPEPINNPIILFFDKPDEEKTKEIPKWTFCFGQAPVVIINKDDRGPFDIYHGYKFESDHSYLLQSLDDDINIFSLINLTLGKTWKTLYNRHFKNVPKVDKYLLNNIVDARRILIASDGLQLYPKIANRLIGRLLFIRYLIDRRVEFTGQEYLEGNDKLTRQISLNEMIKSKDKLYRFFEYLNSRYSGDLFPLKEEEVDQDTGEIYTFYNEEENVTEDHLEVLYDLFSGSSFFKSGTSYKGYVVQKSLFMVYDFEIIPVELISNIYENFIGKEEENLNVVLENFNTTSKQYDIKAYYTPPFIVDYILSQTVSPHLEKSDTSNCKVLDPSCGSGIFLVETLRKIIEKEIQNSGSPDIMLSNERLWELIKNNIFGIDIDEDAIEITIFSLYITLLDYKSPKEIEDFKFERLKHINLFGGKQYDFFNEEASFNEIFSREIALDFIIGNPPWGVVKMSCYESYIKNRKLRAFDANNIKGLTNVILPQLPLEIGNNEISQAFLIRVSDFAINPNLKIALVVTGKSLYNSAATTKQWREYFLSNFVLSEILELSGVNNKIVGGSQIFEGAKMAPAIFFYSLAKSTEEIITNVVTHITVKPNRFFNYFRTIVIEKHDIKKILQRNFIPRLNGYDWLWKVMLHGNVLDFYFMLRLKSYRSIKELMNEYNLDYKGGLKIKDASVSKKKSTLEIRNFLFLNVEFKKEFQQYHTGCSMTWHETVEELLVKNRKGKSERNLIDSEGNVAYLPDPYYFKGEKLLVKKGLLANENFKAVAAYGNEDIVFTSTVCSIKTKIGYSKHENTSVALKSLAGIVNSSFFTYYLLQTSSSAGIDRTRVDFQEIFSAPAIEDKLLAESVMMLQKKHNELKGVILRDQNYSDKLEEIRQLEWDVDQMVYKSFEITDVEKSLINYSTEISLPILKRSEETGYGENNIFRMLSCEKENDLHYLSNYADIFINHFKHRFNSKERSFFANVYIADDFIGFQLLSARHQLIVKKYILKTQMILNYLMKLEI